MRIDGYTPVEVLRHGNSIAYIDLDEGELMHWKYIKRVKLANGKWRYYYDIGKRERSEMSDAKKDLDNAKFAEGISRRNRNEDFERFKNPKNEADFKDASEDLKTSNYWHKKDLADLEYAEKRYREAVLKYEKTPLYKLEKSKKSIKKGMKAISKAFSNLFKKKKK